MDVLGNLLTALGAGDVFNGVKAGYQTSKSAQLRFRVREATRDHVDPSALGAALRGCTFDRTHPLVADGNRYYLVSGVVRTQAISISAEDVTGRTIDFGADALSAANGHADLAINRASTGEVTYRGEQKLAIGVELYELSFDREQRTVKMRLPSKRPRSLRNATGGRAREFEPAFIGGMEGDAFIGTAEAALPGSP